ncbi:uncharacterized protein LOC124126750 [Haliotis rufescens]|uniref:uncharacterized protein LOC124126750 n=1 Tax=Haliotis rufescens TaxID=6454 RepID=UPI001EB02B9A|nr:uncharacterized protein LOC124126750 [Haliotis rufescens]
MMMFNSSLIFVLLAVIAPSLGCSDLETDLGSALATLEAAIEAFGCYPNITDEQCPCMTEDGICLVGNETIDDVECFATKLEVLRNIMYTLLDDLENITTTRPDDCPNLVGCAALVSGCETDEVAVVDPVGTILPSVNLATKVSGLTTADPEACYYVFSYSNAPFTLTTRLENGSDYTNLVLDTGSATGIAHCNAVVYVAFVNGSDTILAIDTLNSNTVSTIADITCSPGKVRVYGSRVYFSDCNEIKSVNKTGGDEQDEVKFSMNIVSFDVLEDGKIVFADTAGGLWVYDETTDCFTLIDCEDTASSDVLLNRCTEFIYVVYPDRAYLSRYNATSFTEGDTLLYTESTPRGCPSLAFEPNCARSVDGNAFP